MEQQIAELFEGNEGREQLDVEKYQFVEEIAKILLKVLCVYVLFVGLNWLGEFLAHHKLFIKGGFNSDVLFSVFVLPLLYSLKDVKHCLESLTVTVWKDDTAVTVKRGGLWCKYDKLYFKNLNNIEFERSLGGKIGKYCTLKLYAVGGITTVPYLKDTVKNKRAVAQLMQLAGQQKNLTQ